MLTLHNICKDYIAAREKVRALRDISISFRKSEFVSVLGPSGCGKTTLLNLIGGLDRYTSGDLIISGKSTGEYRDKDWDTYRCHRVSFVFQSYNLIPHQTILSNVELALTISGVSASVRRRKAREVLERVGLRDQMRKKPNQLSGGQMQRVAIARALINDPEILLADEPTGALDTATSIQVLDLLKEVARDRLVIMVTHNAQLADRYSTRIVRLLDGQITGDTNPYDGASEETQETGITKKEKKPSMSLGTALSLSLNNLLTKKGRAILTCFAGSIGIIGIAMILSLSSGVQNYINDIQSDTLSSYPLILEDETMNTSGMISFMRKIHAGSEDEHPLDAVYSNDIMAGMLESMLAGQTSNDLASFKIWLDAEAETNLSKYLRSVRYGYDVPLNIYASDTSKGVLQLNPSTLFESVLGATDAAAVAGTMSSYSSSFSGADIWEELTVTDEAQQTEYSLIAGTWPDQYDELLLIVDEDNEISDYALYTLGLRDPSEINAMMQTVIGQGAYTASSAVYSYDDILDITFKLVPSVAYYEFNEGSGAWIDFTGDSEYVKTLVDGGITLKITGIARAAANPASSVSGSVGYTSLLIDYVIGAVNGSAIVKDQIARPDIDVFTGLPFGTSGTKITMDDVWAFLKLLPQAEQTLYTAYLSAMTEEQVLKMFAERMPLAVASSTYPENLEKLGVVDPANPSEIDLYPMDFASKDAVIDAIETYNDEQILAGSEDKVIQYTDYVGLLMSSVTTIISAISYVLIAFVAISLIVSSIMIGVITNISVLERTKEIGILRALGASKHDISRVFNAETLIIGFFAGMLGILLTLVFNMPINAVITHLSGISGMSALPPAGGAVLIAVSTLLTLVAGIIPSRRAAKKDPVEALRTE